MTNKTTQRMGLGARPNQPLRTLLMAAGVTALCLHSGRCLSQTSALTGSESASADLSANSVPRLIKYSGTLMDERGYPITVPVEVTFSLYDQESSTQKTALWKETQHVSPNTQGQYAIYLGAAGSRGLPPEVFNSVRAQWLGVEVEGYAELRRTLLVSVPYALKAGDAQTLGGLPVSAFALAGPAASAGGAFANVLPQVAAPAATGSTVTTTGGVTGYVPKFTGTATVADSLIYSGSSEVGINTASPAATLDVNGSTTLRGPTQVASSGTATSSQGFGSHSFDFFSSVYNSSTKAADAPNFVLQSESAGNNTSSTSATLNLLYSNKGTTAETGFYINPNGTVHFGPSQSFPGMVTSVGLSAPSTDFKVTGSPVTGAGTLALAWNTPPTSTNTNSSIVKRDSSGGFQAGLVNGTALEAQGSLTVYGTSYLNAANLAGPVGIGTDSPATLLNLNQNNHANADSLLIGNNSSKGLQLRDTGSGVDIESLGVPLYINNATQADTLINPLGGSVIIDESVTAVNAHGNIPLIVGPGTSYSAYFEGDVIMSKTAYISGDASVEGNLEVSGTKDFRIDDPLEPTQKYLRHAAIESSEVLNQYSGNITTDERGHATVQLPAWFEVENTDFRYQLTVISGQFAQAVVANKVAGSQFTIATNAPGVEVSWQITAKRNDPYMKAHPFVVEQEKPVARRGHYDHPELYGQAPEARR